VFANQPFCQIVLVMICYTVSNHICNAFHYFSYSIVVVKNMACFCFRNKGSCAGFKSFQFWFKRCLGKLYTVMLIL